MVYHLYWLCWLGMWVLFQHEFGTNPQHHNDFYGSPMPNPSMNGSAKKVMDERVKKWKEIFW